MRLCPVLLLAIAHFALSLASGFAARGWDMDQVSSRATLSQMAETLHKVLMFPHDAIFQRLLSLLGWSVPVVLAALIVSSLLWGTALYALWCFLRGAISRARVE